MQEARGNIVGVAPAQDGSTILTADNHQILLTKQSLVAIANKMSALTGVKASMGDIRSLFEYMRETPPSYVRNMSLSKAQDVIARSFINRDQIMARGIREENDLLRVVPRLDEGDTLHEYQRAEIEGLAATENPLKYSAHADRIGIAAINRDRYKHEHIGANRGHPNGVLNQDERQQDYQDRSLRLLESIAGMVNPESIHEIYSRMRATYISYDNLSLPHQVVPFDSRWSNRAHTEPGEFSWVIHNSAHIGGPGDIRVIDTIHNIVQMKICPFWIHVCDTDLQYYDRVRLLFKEFSSQSIIAPNWRDGGCIPDPSRFHFEFTISNVGTNRLHLTPVCDTYKFRKPMAMVDHITTVFYSPFEKIIHCPDRHRSTMSNANPTVITSPANHDLQTGDKIYIELVDTGDTATDILLKRNRGWIITLINDTQYSIPVDLTALAGLTTNVQIYYGSKRVFFNLEFTSLEQ